MPLPLIPLRRGGTAKVVSRKPLTKVRSSSLPVIAIWICLLLASSPARGQPYQPGYPAFFDLWPYFGADEHNELYRRAYDRCSGEAGLAAVREESRLFLEARGLDGDLKHPRQLTSEQRAQMPEVVEQLERLYDLGMRAIRCASEEATRIVLERHGPEPSVFVVPLHVEPNDESEKLGSLVISIVLDEGNYPSLRVEYELAGTPGLHTLVLDIPASDLERGRHTVLAARDGWILLARDPFPKPVWAKWEQVIFSLPEPDPLVDLGALGVPSLQAQDAATGEAVRLEQPGIVITAERGDRFEFRLERPADCNDPRVRDDGGRLYRIEKSQLLDERGHLRTRPRCHSC